VPLARHELWLVQEDGDLCEPIISWLHRKDLADGAVVIACKAGDEARNVSIPYRRIRRLPASDNTG